MNINNIRIFMRRLRKNLYNACCTPKYFYVEKDFESWDPKIHGPRNYLQSFYVAALIEECRNKKHYPLEMFRYNISKNTGSSYKVTMNNGTTLSSSDSKIKFEKKSPCHLKKYQYALLLS